MPRKMYIIGVAAGLGSGMVLGTLLVGLGMHPSVINILGTLVIAGAVYARNVTQVAEKPVAP